MKEAWKMMRMKRKRKEERKRKKREQAKLGDEKRQKNYCDLAGRKGRQKSELKRNSVC